MKNATAWLAPDRLWAKSRIDNSSPASATLLGHLHDVYAAAVALINATGDAQLRAVDLDPERWRDRLRRVVLLSAAVHDLGKANDQFYDMLRAGPRGDGRQALRHEWVTRWLLEQQAVAAWLRPAVGAEDWDAVLWAVSGHHPKYGRSAPPAVNQSKPYMRVRCDEPDFREILRWIRDTFHLGDPPALPPAELDFAFAAGGDGDPIRLLADRHYAAEDAFDDWDDDRRRFLGVVKNCLIAADVAGSALPKDIPAEQRGGWIDASLGRTVLPTAGDYRRLAADRLACTPAEVDAKLRPFQQDVAASTSRVTLVRAGCGTGKTLAAYRWAEAHCDGRRLFVCYPTTGTALEGFNDYLRDPGLPTDLITSRRAIDFALAEDGRDQDDAETVARIESLDLWHRPIVACTVDAVLGVIQNNRRGLFGWPALAQGGFVFDEVHSYDDKLFDALLHFLQSVRGVPVLLMTASLQEGRARAVRELLGDDLTEVGGPAELEAVPRYRRQGPPVLAASSDPDAAIRDAYAAGARVLRVCNTVGAALRQAEAVADLAPIIYHSRFKYVDRVDRHRQAVAAFQQDVGPALAVCTQVVEVSLDLKHATLLVTDLAPVPALIQRLGRLNRAARAGDPPGSFIVVEPTDGGGRYRPLPYEADDLETARRWLELLGDGPLSQADLAAAWRTLTDDPMPRMCRGESAWLDSGPATPVLELREGSPSVTVILREDVDRLPEHPRVPAGVSPVAALSLSMPPRPRALWEEGDGRKFRGVRIAREGSIEYDPMTGARWTEVNRSPGKSAGPNSIVV